MAVTTLHAGEIWVSYAQAYVQDGFDWRSDDMKGCFAGQRNGLCGAGVPGGLWLITGLHTGRVGFTAEFHDERPETDSAWEDVVEVSFQVRTDTLQLIEWGASNAYALAIPPGSYRVRYSSEGRDRAHDKGQPVGDPVVDRYLLQFWPAPPAPDEVLRQTSAQAAYWHEFARALPAPPTPAERAVAARIAQQERERDRLARERQEAEQRQAAAARAWGVPPPATRLRAVPGNVRWVVEMDPALADLLMSVGPVTQRQVARWVARRALVEAHLADVAWIAPVMAALADDRPLPSPFDGEDQPAWDRLFSDPSVPSTVVASLDGRHENCLQQSMAIPAVFAVQEPEPLIAALEALWHAANTFGRGRTQILFRELRESFPGLAPP